VNPVRLALLLAAALGCGPQPPAHEPTSSAAVSITDREWVFASLEEHPAPAGAGGRPATLRLEAASARAVGFGGCNRFSAGYRRAGDSLTFGPVISTKMSCADGDELERSFLAMLPAVATFQATDSALTFYGPSGILARFR
jgi:heat shock protein HslJ